MSVPGCGRGWQFGAMAGARPVGAIEKDNTFIHKGREEAEIAVPGRGLLSLHVGGDTQALRFKVAPQ